MGAAEETRPEDALYSKSADVERGYRALQSADLKAFRVEVGESDLWVLSSHNVKVEIEQLLIHYRRQLKEYIHNHPVFAKTLQTYPADPEAPELIRRMIAVSAAVAVGPMAAVAGAVAGIVGTNIPAEVTDLIIENGGDIYLRSSRERIIGIYAGNSPFSLKIGLKIKPQPQGFGICTSAGTVGPSFSFGKADAAVICAPDPALADAAASAVGNLVQSTADLTKAIQYAQTIPELCGALVIKEDKMCAWGEIELVPLSP